MRIIKEAESWWQDVEELTDAQMKERFIALARQKRLPPTVVLVCLYTLFTPDKEYGRVCLMKLLLFGPHNKTMQYHNYQIYKSLHSQERRLFGEILENCPMPLFPPYSEIANLNEDVRDIVSHGKLTGGSEMNEEESP
ncbi:hypothetical protein ABB37_09900 [Leptomonas pyrrhocoris]|nr:hypothetical protein ABB37_09900 [Leptomonas pyrrhocoris]KPA73341.1 hypothetical protein ABB37_09900 [Leptomonas pyrrhocoris]|eukprot:XP_015651780.1 hypothetical protein ABB37_09900 [Leptomonas pyrrhocoris]